MTNAVSPVIRVLTDELRRRRYPTRVWVGGALTELVVEPTDGLVGGAENDVAIGPTDDQVVGTILDGDSWRVSAPSGSAVLLSVDLLATALRADEARLPQGAWLPLLPADFHVDVTVAQQHVGSGEIGQPLVINITTPVGIPRSDGWDLDHLSALSRLEALTFGLRVAERLVDATVRESTCLTGRHGVQTFVHQLDGGVKVVHHIVPARSTAATGFEGAVLGESGQLTLRRQFAPGRVGIWRNDHPGYIFPSVPEDKHDVQAPDSVGGGWEMSALIAELVSPGPHAARLRDDAIRLVRHATEL